MTFARRIKAKIWYETNRALGPVMELVASRQNMAQVEGPIFVLGAPRCGSTLIMQVLTDAFQLGYLSNVHCRWFGAPGLAERWLKPLEKKPPSTYSSVHGQTPHRSDPAECGNWWYRFFRRHPPIVRNGDITKRKRQQLRRSVQLLQTEARSPLIFKNLYAGLRLQPLLATFPNSLFVVVHRDMKDNAHSILRGRLDAQGNYEDWWSVPPPNVAELAALRPVEQVVGQIDAIYSLLARDLREAEIEQRVLHISYEDFCQNTIPTLREFESFLHAHGMMVRRRVPVPERFELPSSIQIPRDMYVELTRCVNERTLKRAENGH